MGTLPLALNAPPPFFEALGQPPGSLGRGDVRALAGEIDKQAVHEIDHDDAVADEAEAYRDNLAEATAHHLSEAVSEKVAELEAAIGMPGERASSPGGLKHGDPQISREELLERYFGAVPRRAHAARHRILSRAADLPFAQQPVPSRSKNWAMPRASCLSVLSRMLAAPGP